MTFRSGQHSSQIDFILARREDRRDCLDSRVIPGECVVPQHKLVVPDFHFSGTCSLGQTCQDYENEVVET